MPWHIAIIKMAGETLAKEALKDFSGPHVAKIKQLLFGEDKDEVKEYLEKLDGQIRELARSLQDIELRQIFLEYNRADEELAHLFDLYSGQTDKPLDDRDRQNTCSYILDINKGVSERARRMIGAFRHINLPSYKTLLQEYSDKLVDKQPDLYSYCDKMEAVVSHLKMNLMEAAVLREVCYRDIADKERVTDLALTEAEMRRVEQHYDEVVGPAVELKNQFEALAGSGDYVRLRHHATRKFLTAFEGGSPSTKAKPFGSDGMPQLYLYGHGRGQVEKYKQPQSVMTEAGTITMKDERELRVEGKSQDWKVIKIAGGDGQVRFAFQLLGGEKVLDGVNGGRVYLNALPADRKNEYMWWQPVMAKNGDGKFEPGVFMLRHVRTEFALDSDGGRVYADDRKPNYGNPHMKWRLDRKNSLEGDEYLTPGEKLVSANGRYELRYLKDGNLELYDKTGEKAVWQSDTAGKGAWRCVMQKDDGHFVVYAREKEAVWFTDRYGSQFADSRLVLRDGGFFEIIDRKNNVIYDTKWSLRRKNIHALEPDEFLEVGETLVSTNQRYELGYRSEGRLELFDRIDKKILWGIDTAGKGAWRCVMRKDEGRFVILDQEKQVVWFTTPYGSEYAGGSLALLVNGVLCVTRRGKTVWRKMQNGDED